MSENQQKTGWKYKNWEKVNNLKRANVKDVKKYFRKKVKKMKNIIDFL